MTAILDEGMPSHRGWQALSERQVRMMAALMRVAGTKTPWTEAEERSPSLLYTEISRRCLAVSPELPCFLNYDWGRWARDTAAWSGDPKVLVSLISDNRRHDALPLLTEAQMRALAVVIAGERPLKEYIEAKPFFELGYEVAGTSAGIKAFGQLLQLLFPKVEDLKASMNSNGCIWFSHRAAETQEGRLAYVEVLKALFPEVGDRKANLQSVGFQTFDEQIAATQAGTSELEQVLHDLFPMSLDYEEAVEIIRIQTQRPD
jgi:hypothetical protein